MDKKAFSTGIFFLVSRLVFGANFASIGISGSFYDSDCSSSDYFAGTTSTINTRVMTLGGHCSDYLGNSLGIMGSMSIEIAPIYAEANSSQLDSNNYILRTTENGLIGLGYRKTIGEDFCLLGFGAHFSMILIGIPINTALPEPYSLGGGILVGPGISASYYKKIFEKMYMGIVSTVGYDFYNVLGGFSDASIDTFSLQLSVDIGFDISR